MGKYLLWFAILVIVLNSWGSSGCLEEERIALLQVKAHIKKKYKSSLISWVNDNKSDCCEWPEVKCNNTTGRVIELYLSSTTDYRAVEWYINASVFLPFKQLNYLDLSKNKLAGAVENEGFDKLSSLSNFEKLDVCANHLNRSILSSLSQLSSLKYLNLSGNWFYSISNNSGHERLSGLRNLEVLEMTSTWIEDNNVLLALNLKDFINLKELDISNNNFQSFGPINGGGGLKKLEMLHLKGNKFNNSIFQSLKGFHSLKILDLGQNNFHGPLHIEDIKALSNLEVLDLSYNFIESFETSASLSGLSKTNSHLQMLHLNGILSFNITKLLQPLAALPSIETLELEGGNITSIDAIHALRNLSNLEVLFLDGSHLHKDFLQSIESMNLLRVLSLQTSQLGGTLPNKGWCELKNLQELGFSENQYEGMLPSCLGNLTSLRLVDLSSNMLTGNIDSSPLSTLMSLECLSISSNSFEVPVSFKSFANHSKLRFIFADENKAIAETELLSIVPKFQLNAFTMSNCNGLFKLPRFLHYQHDLEVLKISRNNLEGEFPSWLLQNNTKLLAIYMNYNAFTGIIKLPPHPNLDLYVMDLSNNKLSEEIPGNLSSTFPNIGTLNLSYNLLRGQIPSYLGSLKHLEILDLSNNSLSGEIPKELLIGCSSLLVLKLSNNKLEGEIVQEFAYLSSLWLLYLDGNSFTGTILDSLSNIPLWSLDISGNKFSGKISRWMGHMTSLGQLILSNNHLEGPIPIELCNLERLTVLDFSQNNLTGSIPSCLNPPFIKHVRLSKNQLGGQLTHAFFNNTALVIFDLSYNGFVGTIPEWIGSMSKLSILLLKGNQFEGKIPMQVCQLTSLSVLDLSNNQLTGLIPRCLGKMSLEGTDEKSTAVGSLYLGFNNEPTMTYHVSFSWTREFEKKFPINGEPPEVEFTTKGNIYYYEGNVLTYMSGIDLSSNRLTGEIPFDELGNLTEIRALNLSHNNLTGTIPEKFSMLHNIESLDLSHNMLSGKIPNTLLKLTWLEVFTVAYNNLTGAIPELNAQFETFGESSYEGNPYLCGPPLDISCSSPKPSTSPLPPDSNGESEESNVVDMEVFYISFGVSYVVFLLAILLVLYINPYWRNTWFHLIEVIVYKCFGRGKN